MKTLHLNLKRQWFDKINSDDKTEEYREIKESIVSLLFDWKKSGMTRKDFTVACRMNPSVVWEYLKGDDNTTITFSNGYAKDRDQFEIEWVDIKTGEGNPEWGAEPGVNYFILTLGDFI